MTHTVATPLKKISPATWILAIALLAAVAFGIYTHRTFTRELEANQQELASRTLAFEQQISQMTTENHELEDALTAEKRRNDDFEEQIEELSGTISQIDKLRRLDPELLKKYSKVAFLNENYLPERLTEIDKEWLSNPSTKLMIHAKVNPFFEGMLEDAKDDKIDIKIVSAYRSFGTQAAIKDGYKVIYGSGANAFSADQGYSEHQLGSAVDLSTPALVGALDNRFEPTEAFKWLQANAQKYGFILSYPKGNTYYQYEPWHWRFVGVKLAKDLKKDNKNFYDLDQRDIDKYLITIFD